MIRSTPKPTEGKEVIAFSYIRFSTPEQAAGRSLDRQLEMARDYAKLHGLLLDDSSYRDLGISAFKGKNLDAKNALGAFLAAIKSKKIPSGSVLLVESLDRLSRDEVEEALELFLSIIRAGIKIVTLQDDMEFEKGKLDMTKLVVAISYMSRATNESQTKRMRLKDSQKDKRERIRGGKFVATKLPAWIVADVTERDHKGRAIAGRYCLDPDRVKIIRRVVELYSAGNGLRHTAQKLNEAGVPTFRKGKLWGSSSVYDLLTSTSLMGDYQTAAVVEPVKNYFPPVISAAEFTKIGNALANRCVQRGRRTNTSMNLFPGMLVDHDGNHYHVLRRSLNPNNGRSMVQRPTLFHALRDKTKDGMAAFPYVEFEAAILAVVNELSPEQLTGKAVAVEKQELADKRDALDELNRRIKATVAKVEASPDFESLVMVLERLETKKDQLVREVNALERFVCGADTTDLRAAKTILATLAETPEPKRADMRLRLRGLIVNLIDRVEIKTSSPRPFVKLALATIRYRHGGFRHVGIRCVRSGRSEHFKIEALFDFDRNKETNVTAATFIAALGFAEQVTAETTPATA